MGSRDLSTIPYDAPLSFAEPSWFWTQYMGLKGTNNQKLTRKDVPLKDLSGQWIIITGANNGIGREAALFFAQCGASVILACRDPPPHEQHPNKVVDECYEAARGSGKGEKQTFEWWEIDMTKLRTVEAFAKRWLETGRALDILCNNAGMGGNPGGLAKTLKTEDGFEFVHQVNFTSHVLLTMYLLPSLAAAPAPRIVCTTSCMTYFGKYNLANFNGAGCRGVQFYNNNKLYYQCWLTELHYRMLRSPDYKKITVNGVHPGYVNSGVWAPNVVKESAGSGLLHSILQLINTLLHNLLQFMARNMAISPEQGSFCITNAATSLEAGPDPKVQGVGPQGGLGGGRYYNRIWETENMPHPRDADARLRVWRKVDEELQLSQKGLLKWTQ